VFVEMFTQAGIDGVAELGLRGVTADSNHNHARFGATAADGENHFRIRRVFACPRRGDDVERWRLTLGYVR